jgi:hypothetical protein
MLELVVAKRTDDPFLGKLKNFILFCLLDDKHPEAEHVRLLPVYSARDNTKIKTQSR